MSDAELAPLPGPLLLARELAALGVPMTVVGSTAALLRTGRGQPRDLDVVAAPGVVPRLMDALWELGVPQVPSGVPGADPVTVPTGWCRGDVFSGSGGPSGPVVVDGITLDVSS